MGDFPLTKGEVKSYDKFQNQYYKLKKLADKRAKRHGEKIVAHPDTDEHIHVKEGFEGAIEILEEIIKESSHKRKYGNSNAEDGDTVGHLGTKYFKDGSAMHPHRVTKSNGYNGVDYAPHGTEYYDFDDKKVLQNTIKKLKKEGKEGLEGEEFKKVQKELTNPDTKNNMYGAPVRWASWKLANRKGKSDLPHKGIGVYTYRKGKDDGSKTKDDNDVKERVKATKNRLTNESYTLSELFDRPDLLDDISMALTNKTIKQHLQNQAKKLLGGKKKVACKACEGFEEATALLEEIINDVSMTKWTETAREVIPKRKADFKNKEKAYMKSIGGNEKNPEETWYKLTKGIGYPENKEYYEFKDAVKRKNHAEKVSDLNKGSGSASANKVITKANKVADKRYKEDENSGRTWHAANLGNEDPVKSKVWKR
jgi:hypothetical protein